VGLGLFVTQGFAGLQWDWGLFVTQGFARFLLELTRHTHIFGQASWLRSSASLLYIEMTFAKYTHSREIHVFVW